jgi:aspartate racemase
LKSVGLLASPTTIRTGLYKTILNERGIAQITLSAEEQLETEVIIRAVIADDRDPSEQLRKQIARLQSAGAEMVILGCTELSFVLKGAKLPFIIDPFELAVEKMLQSSSGTV